MTRRRVTVCLCSVMLIGIAAAATQNQTPEESSYGALRRLAKNAQSEMSVDETYQVSRELVKHNVGIALMRPIPADETVLERLAAVVAASYARDWIPTVDPRVVVGAPFLGLISGLGAGIIPAWKAARIEPAEALRR